MLVFGGYETMPYVSFDPMSIPGINKYIIMNLYSIYDQGIRLDNLVPCPIPPAEIVLSEDQLVFDGMYINYLITNPYAFTDLMKIMYPLYENSDILVYILVGNDIYRDCITQSLIKFIQERYGYVSNYISDISDIECLQHSSFNSFGILNFDQDKARYIDYLIQNNQLDIPNAEGDNLI